MNIRPMTAKAVDDYILDQIDVAFQAGESTMVLRVPVNLAEEDNWPHPSWYGSRIATTLNRHGIIERQMSIIVEPDFSVNNQVNLPY